MIGFVELCERIEELWRTRRTELDSSRPTSSPRRSAAVRARARRRRPAEHRRMSTRPSGALVGSTDRERGGLGGAPKFPQPMAQEVLLAAAARGDLHARAALSSSRSTPWRLAASTTTSAVASPATRSTAIWLVPHFEKMLYDNALLIRLYTHGWLLTGEPRFRQVVAETIGYLLRDLRQPTGGVSSAEDADSEGEEGKFYVWTEEEVREVLADEVVADAADLALQWYGVRPGGNFEHGTTILNRIHARGDLLRPPAVEAARQTLFDRSRHAGASRPRRQGAHRVERLPRRRAGRGRGGRRRAGRGSRPRSSIATFLLEHLRRDDGRWLRSWQADAGARHLAYATDHGALVDAFTRLAEATGEARWIDEARAAADALLDLFWDAEHGGVFTSGHDAEALIARPKDLMDNATPGANGLAAVGLLRLAALTGDERYRDRGLDIVRLLGPLAVQHPTAFGHVLAAVDLAVRGTTEVVVAGDRPDLLRHGAPPLPPQRGPRLGRALRQPPLGRPGRRPGLRLPELHLQAPSRDTAKTSTPSSGPDRLRLAGSTTMVAWNPGWARPTCRSCGSSGSGDGVGGGAGPLSCLCLSPSAGSRSA